MRGRSSQHAFRCCSTTKALLLTLVAQIVVSIPAPLWVTSPAAFERSSLPNSREELSLAGTSNHFCLVIGWSQNHHAEGMCMLKWLPNVPEFRSVHFVDMGISAASSEELRQQLAQGETSFKIYDPSDYMPEHAMKFWGRHTGFKSIALRHMMGAGHFAACDVVWWADSSVRFTRRFRLSSPEQRPHPLWGVKAHSTGYQHRPWAHPELYRIMGVAREHDRSMGVQGGTLALDLSVPHARQLLHMWADCCSDLKCIMPPGASRQYTPQLEVIAGRESLRFAHRDDQTVLNLAMQKLFGAEVLGKELTLDLHRHPFVVERHDSC